MYYTDISKVYIHCKQEEMKDVIKFFVTNKATEGAVMPITFLLPAIYIIVHKIDRILSKDDYIALLMTPKIVYIETGNYDLSFSYVPQGKYRVASVKNIKRDRLYDILIKRLEEVEKYEDCANLYAAYEYICVHG